jgi:hypothetical protein
VIYEQSYRLRADIEGVTPKQLPAPPPASADVSKAEAKLSEE